LRKKQFGRRLGGVRFVGILLGLSLLGLPSFLCAQQAPTLFGYVRGQVRDKANRPIARAVISTLDNSKSAITDSAGNYRLTLPVGKVILVCRDLTHYPEQEEVNVREGFTEFVAFAMAEKPIQLADVNIRADRDPTRTQQSAFDEVLPISTRKMGEMTRVKPDIESILSLLPGVGVSSEFSSQYRVRGGNYDENLIYIDDVEIYRPQLTRAGQQEGLGFTNANLADAVTFSSGGFQAKYGDKLSSVLNITYKTPSRFRATAEVGVLTLNFHIEGSVRSKKDTLAPPRFTYLFGFRRFSTATLLNTQDTQGEYRPNFLDLQAVLRWTPKVKNHPLYHYRERKNGTVDTLLLPSDPIRVSLLLIGANNDYLFRPKSRETTIGTLQQAFRLYVAFDGEEHTSYLTGQTALTIEHRPRYNLTLKYIASVFHSSETEVFSTEGGYRLADVNTNFGSSEFNEVTFVRGIGSELRNARNYLDISVWNVNMKGEWTMDKDFYKKLNARSFKHKLLWGASYQQEIIQDKLKEWTAIDSSGYVNITELIQSKNNIVSHRVSGYVQYNWNFHPMFRLSVGTRLTWWSRNNEVVASPRLQLVFDPSNVDSNKTYQLRLAVGMYNQPPLYRELRDFDGKIINNVKAQQSIHFILGADYSFKIRGRPFKIYGEVFYKLLNNLIPYEIENVRIRYYPQYTATGYAYGVDLKINGQFIRDVDSWISLSILKTGETINSSGRGEVRRPADNRVQLGIYFQDEIPRLPAFKMNLNLVFNSGIPFGPPQSLKSSGDNRTKLQMPPYLRIDLGLSRLLTFKPYTKKGYNPVESAWISLELLNFISRQNTVSYLWVNDAYGSTFAIPNYLSSIMVNARVIVRFSGRRGD
jgi:hypothetical protein